MTNKEAILSFPGLAEAPDNFIEKTIIDRDFDGGETYSLDTKSKVELCAADIYMMVVNSPDFSEGNLTIKISRAQMLITAKALYNKNGEPDTFAALNVQPTIEDRSSIW